MTYHEAPENLLCFVLISWLSAFLLSLLPLIWVVTIIFSRYNSLTFLSVSLLQLIFSTDVRKFFLKYRFNHMSPWMFSIFCAFIFSLDMLLFSLPSMSFSLSLTWWIIFPSSFSSNNCLSEDSLLCSPKIHLLKP